MQPVHHVVTKSYTIVRTKFQGNWSREWMGLMWLVLCDNYIRSPRRAGTIYQAMTAGCTTRPGSLESVKLQPVATPLAQVRRKELGKNRMRRHQHGKSRQNFDWDLDICLEEDGTAVCTAAGTPARAHRRKMSSTQKSDTEPRAAASSK